MATRKDNFWKYYQANPSKLGGRSIQGAYDAMQREASRKDFAKGKDPLIRRTTGGRDNSSVSDPIRNAVARRVTGSRGNSVAARAAAPGQVKKTGPGSPYKQWANKGFPVGPKKGSVWSNHAASQKPGAKALWFDDILGHKDRQAKYADKRRIEANKKAPRKSAIERRVSGR